jgi:hypothetical protein
MGGGHDHDGSEAHKGVSGDDATWHRIFAASAFNQAWDQIDKEWRSAEDEASMLLAAFASR